MAVGQWAAIRMLKKSLCAAALASAFGLVSGAQVPAIPVPIAWSATRALAWSDFVGKPDLASDAGATTVYRLAYQERCTDSFTFTVTSVFQPAESWVRPSVLESPEARRRLLVHEQGHFDLSEISARKLRRGLSRLPHPCGMTSIERRTFVEHHLREDADAQARYDSTTNYGLNETHQIRAVIEIGRELAALAEFAAR